MGLDARKNGVLSISPKLPTERLCGEFLFGSPVMYYWPKDHKQVSFGDTVNLETLLGGLQLPGVFTMLRVAKMCQDLCLERSAKKSLEV